MKLFLSVFALLLQTVITAQSPVVYAKEPVPGFAHQRISVKEMQLDIIFWQQIMEESHVNLYHSISKDSLELLSASLLAKYKDSLTHTEAVLLIGTLAAALNEGHIGLPSSKISDSSYNNAIRFPYLLKQVSDGAWVVDREISYHPQLEQDSRIIEVNGIPVGQLNKRFRKYFGGMESWRNQQIGSYVRKLIFLEGIQAPFQIKAIQPNNKTVRLQVSGFNKEVADSMNKILAAGTRNAEPYTYRLLSEGIACINYRQMVNPASNPFDSFLNKSFRDIQLHQARGLIIDLRENGGGNSKMGELLLNYFNTKPYRLSSGMKWKVSTHYKKFIELMKERYDGGTAAFYLALKNGDVQSFDQIELKKSNPAPYRFNGPVVVLTGPNTFSSANMLADGIKSYRLATVIGEPTGEPGNDFGEMFQFMLPRTQIIARASSKMFQRADGDVKNFQPILPDILVRPVAGKDAVMEAAVRFLQER
ncbi:MAG: S41 family peptidase [Sediminibacterium sp.]|nr:S41 family peptidase [Sediminibacterium sp.]